MFTITASADIFLECSLPEWHLARVTDFPSTARVTSGESDLISLDCPDYCCISFIDNGNQFTNLGSMISWLQDNTIVRHSELLVQGCARLQAARISFTLYSSAIPTKNASCIKDIWDIPTKPTPLYSLPSPQSSEPKSISLSPLLADLPYLAMLFIF